MGAIRANKVSTGWIYHTRDIYRCYVQDRIIEFARFDESQTQRQVNAFIMSGLFSHPTPASYCFVMFMTPPTLRSA